MMMIRCILFTFIFYSVASLAQWKTNQKSKTLPNELIGEPKKDTVKRFVHDPIERINSAADIDINLSKEFFSTINSTSPCQSSVDNFFGNQSILSLYSDTNKATGMFCVEGLAFEITPYTKEYCENIDRCAAANFKDLAKLSDARLHVQKVIADDYVQHELTVNIREMEKLENIMKFMKQKFPDDVQGVCASKFRDTVSEKSCTDSINKNFMSTQVGCKSVKENCYVNGKDGFDSYPDFVKDNGGLNKNTFNMYFTQKTDKRLSEYLKTENQATIELLKILTGKGTKKEKEEIFYKSLDSPEFSKKLDPIVTYSDPNLNFELRFQEMKKNFGSFIENALKEKKSLDQLVKDFQQVRIDLGNKIIGDNCSFVPSYESLCVNSEIIQGGTRESKVSVDIKQVLNQRKIDFGDNLADRISLIGTKIPLGRDINPANFSRNTALSKFLLENARCSSFKFTFGGAPRERSWILAGVKGAVGTPEFGDDYLATNPELRQFAKLAASEKLGVKERIALARERAKDFKLEVENPGNSFWDKKYLFDEKKYTGGSDKKGQDTPQEKELLNPRDRSLQARREEIHVPVQKEVQSNVAINKASSNTASSKDDFDFSMPKTDLRIQGQDHARWSNVPTNTSFNSPSSMNQIDENKPSNVKAENAEKSIGVSSIAKVEKSKATSKIDNEYRERTTSGPEESSSSLDQLRELRNEISRLKESNEQEEKLKALQMAEQEKLQVATKNNSASSNPEQEFARQSNTSSGLKQESGGGQGHSNSSVASNSSSSSSSDSSDDDSRSSSSQGRYAQASHAKNESSRGSSSAGVKGGDSFSLVLNSQETSVEQNEQAIVENIIASDGKTFEVMMDGVPVKVVPTVEKGKLVFERGRPKYKIFVKDEKITNEAKSIGELKRQQEKDFKATADRAQYAKFKEISGKVLKDK